MNKIQLQQLCPTQISNTMIRADFSVFVQRKPQKYSNHIKQKKKVKVPFGRSEKDKQQLTLPGLVYDVNYDSVMPNKRAAIIHSKPRTKRSITEQDEPIHLPRIEMKRENSFSTYQTLMGISYNLLQTQRLAAYELK
ncbi:hypothetical protein pb186bvf_017281 [Paramecium bursaria]